MLNTSSTLDRTTQVINYSVSISKVLSFSPKDNFESFHVDQFSDYFHDSECSGRCWIVASCLVNSSSTKGNNSTGHKQGKIWDIYRNLAENSAKFWAEIWPQPWYNSAATITLTTAKEESCNKRCQRSVDWIRVIDGGCGEGWETCFTPPRVLAKLLIKIFNLLCLGVSSRFLYSVSPYTSTIPAITVHIAHWDIEPYRGAYIGRGEVES